MARPYVPFGSRFASWCRSPRFARGYTYNVLMHARLGHIVHAFCVGSFALHPSFGRSVSKVSCGTDKQGHGDEVLSVFSAGRFSFLLPLVGFGGAEE